VTSDNSLQIHERRRGERHWCIQLRRPLFVRIKIDALDDDDDGMIMMMMMMMMIWKLMMN
jgi:hypothetical protein